MLNAVSGRLALAVLLVAGCAGSPETTAYPKLRPLGRDLVIPPELGLANTGGGTVDRPLGASLPKVSTGMGEPTGHLTLQRALAQTLVGSPELSQFSYDVRSAEARALQAGYRPNPDIQLQAEDFAGNRDQAGFRNYQGTLTLSQLVELGGKRRGRVRLAHLETSLAGWNYETQRLDVLTETTRAFMNVLTAQRRVALADEGLRLEQQFYGAVSERTRAGDVSSLEERRAQVARSNGQILIEQARRDLTAARARLAASWGSKTPLFNQVEGDLGSGIKRPPDLPALLKLAEQNPDLARWETEIAQREAKLAVEQSRNVPDITVNAGIRNYGPGRPSPDAPAVGGGYAFVGGIGLPLPISGMNQGNVLDARAQLEKSQVQRQAAEIRVTAAIQQSFERISAAYETITALRRNVMPAAQTAYEGISTGYRQGKFSLLEVLDARRALFDARNRLIDAEASYKIALAETERLIGQPLESIPVSSPVARPGEKP